MRPESREFYDDRAASLEAALEAAEEERDALREEAAALTNQLRTSNERFEREIAVPLQDRWKELATTNRRLVEEVAALSAELRDTKAALEAMTEQRDALLQEHGGAK